MEDSIRRSPRATSMVVALVAEQRTSSCGLVVVPIDCTCGCALLVDRGAVCGRFIHVTAVVLRVCCSSPSLAHRLTHCFNPTSTHGRSMQLLCARVALVRRHLLLAGGLALPPARFHLAVCALCVMGAGRHHNSRHQCGLIASLHLPFLPFLLAGVIHFGASAVGSLGIACRTRDRHSGIDGPLGLRVAAIGGSLGIRPLLQCGLAFIVDEFASVPGDDATPAHAPMNPARGASASMLHFASAVVRRRILDIVVGAVVISGGGAETVRSAKMAHLLQSRHGW
mmetsp:Transcript_5606/g.15199  ORF Transcript_5606/g.15199 Transcript_5606/m.15199 type:complete len:282 (-) Transcript_5606:189-1034(-)